MRLDNKTFYFIFSHVLSVVSYSTNKLNEKNDDINEQELPKVPFSTDVRADSEMNIEACLLDELDKTN